MKIAVDCRYLGLSGIGRFLESILDYFDFSSQEFVLIGKEKLIKKYSPAKYIIDDNSPFSIKGLFKINKKEINKCDVFFTPNFIIPYGIKIRVVSMLHDIIFMDHKEWNKNFIDTLEKKFLLKKGLKKSDTVFSVSNFSKSRIEHFFPKYFNKVIFSYPGVSEKFFNKFNNELKENYIIYVGNVKRSKGLHTLVKAFDILADSNLKLYIVGDYSNFRNKDKELDKYFENKNIVFTGKISDDELIEKVQKAKFLIQPSFYEGFGSTPLEAIYLGTKPIISDIDVFKEVYQDLPVTFFNVGNSFDLADKIRNTNPTFTCDLDKINLKYSYKLYSNIIFKALTKR